MLLLLISLFINNSMASGPCSDKEEITLEEMAVAANSDKACSLAENYAYYEAHLEKDDCENPTEIIKTILVNEEKAEYLCNVKIKVQCWFEDWSCASP